MKKILKSTVSVLLAMLILNLQTIASTNVVISSNEDISVDEAVSFDESEIYSQFEEVDELVAYIETNEDATFDELKAKNSDLIANVSSGAAIASTVQDDLRPPIMGAFLWGCLFNVVGIIVVAVTTDSDRDQIRSSVWGCVASSLASTVLYIAVWGSMFAAASTASSGYTY